jgi:hypothetical protein
MGWSVSAACVFAAVLCACSSDAQPDADAGDAMASDVAPPNDASPDVGANADAAPSGACSTLGAWATTAPFADAGRQSHAQPSVAFGTSYCVWTITTPYVSSQSWIYCAKQNGDGSLSPWQQSPHPHGGHQGFTAATVDGKVYMFRNGHIATYEVSPSGDALTGNEITTEASQATAYGGHYWMWDSAVYAPFADGTKWVVHLSGFDMTLESTYGNGPGAYPANVYAAKVPVPQAFTSTSQKHPASLSSNRPGKSAFIAGPGQTTGYVFVTIDAYGSPSPALWRASLTSAGALSSFTQMPDMPIGDDNQRGDVFFAGQTLFVVRGSKVFGADVDASTGNLKSWTTQPDLPEPQIDLTWGGESEGQAWGVIGDYVYLTGQKTVHYARITHVPCKT